MIQIGSVYTTFCQEEGIHLQKYRDRNGRCIAILFKSIGVKGPCDFSDLKSVCNNFGEDGIYQQPINSRDVTDLKNRPLTCLAGSQVHVNSLARLT